MEINKLIEYKYKNNIWIVDVIVARIYCIAIGGKLPPHIASCRYVRQVAVTCHRGTSVVRNLKFLTLLYIGRQHLSTTPQNTYYCNICILHVVKAYQH